MTFCHAGGQVFLIPFLLTKSPAECKDLVCQSSQGSNWSPKSFLLFIIFEVLVSFGSTLATLSWSSQGLQTSHQRGQNNSTPETSASPQWPWRSRHGTIYGKHPRPSRFNVEWPGTHFHHKRQGYQRQQHCQKEESKHDQRAKCPKPAKHNAYSVSTVFWTNSTRGRQGQKSGPHHPASPGPEASHTRKKRYHPESQGIK